jgi:tetratricopeptide (TPR) repeat protein
VNGNDQERWRRVDGILEAALELPAGERAAFLERTCGGDAELRREVEALLAHDGADGFLGSSASTEAARLLMGAAPPPLVGQRIGTFEVLAGIGKGGMGEVYLAQDTRLQRRVALKRIPAHLASDPERVIRFRREALATSALNHPNVVTVYEILAHEGGDLMVTELVDGVSLRQRMREGAVPFAAALDIVLQIARGLAAAHAVGIVHRDVKPANVMVRRDGLVKVVDFGVAKSPPQPLAAPGRATAPGELIGTVGYMSPEQARGLPVDARTDVWSLGVIFYELATGGSPFPGATPFDRLGAILEREPEPPSHRRPGLPAALDGVIARALAKDAADRYGDAAELAADLERLRSASGRALAPATRRLAGVRWRAGMGAAAALALALVLGLAVWRPTSEPAPPELAPGTVPGPGSAAPRATEPGTQEAYLRARRFLSRRTVVDLRTASGLFEQVLAREPGYAAAEAGWATTLALLASSEDSIRNAGAARAHAVRALSLDPSCAEAHAALGLLTMNHDGDWPAAEASFRRALAIKPDDVTANHWLGEMLSLLGRPDEGLALLERAHQADPASLIVATDIVKALFLARRYDQAIARGKEVVELDPEFAQVYLWSGYAHILRGGPGDVETGLAEVRLNARLDPSPLSRGYLALALGRAGRGAEARRILQELEIERRSTYIRPAVLAMARLGLREHAAAISELERELDSGGSLLGISVGPLWQELRPFPGFAAVLRRANLDGPVPAASRG